MKHLILFVTMLMSTATFADASCLPKKAFENTYFDWKKEIREGTCYKESTTWVFDPDNNTLILKGRTSRGVFKATWKTVPKIRSTDVMWQIHTLQVTGKTYKMSETMSLEASNTYRHIKHYYYNVYASHFAKRQQELEKQKQPKVKQFH